MGQWFKIKFGNTLFLKFIFPFSINACVCVKFVNTFSLALGSIFLNSLVRPFLHFSSFPPFSTSMTTAKGGQLPYLLFFAISFWLLGPSYFHCNGLAKVGPGKGRGVHGSLFPLPPLFLFFSFPQFILSIYIYICIYISNTM